MRLQLLTTLFFFTSAITTLALHSPKTASFRRYSSLARASYDSWEERANAIFEKDKRPVILFDGICNMCNGGVNFALDYDRKGEFRFAALQSEAGRALLQRSGRKPDDISSIVLVDQKGAYIKSEAVLRIAQKLGSLFPLLGLVGLTLPRFGRDAIYDQVANNRYKIFGQGDSCRVSDDNFEARFIAD